jgi:hypothetical protein
MGNHPDWCGRIAVKSNSSANFGRVHEKAISPTNDGPLKWKEKPRIRKLGTCQGQESRGSNIKGLPRSAYMPTG